jgi:PAS domain S-box-containing protein
MVYRCRNDPEWTMEYVSPGCARLTGYQPHELLENRAVAYGELIHPDHRERVWEAVQRAVADERAFDLEYPIVTRDGTQKWVRERGHPVLLDGALQAIEGYVADVTDEQQIRRALRRSEAYFRALTENALDVIPAGVFPPNPSEILGSQRMRDLLASMRTRYEMIIVDAPPLNLVTDAAVLGTAADTTILVARVGITDKRALQHAATQLFHLNAPLAGVVLNDIDLSGGAYYGYSYGYGYGHGYGHGYSSRYAVWSNVVIALTSLPYSTPSRWNKATMSSGLKLREPPKARCSV